MQVPVFRWLLKGSCMVMPLRVEERQRQIVLTWGQYEFSPDPRLTAEGRHRAAIGLLTELAGEISRSADEIERLAQADSGVARALRVAQQNLNLCLPDESE